MMRIEGIKLRLKRCEQTDNDGLQELLLTTSLPGHHGFVGSALGLLVCYQGSKL